MFYTDLTITQFNIYHNKNVVDDVLVVIVVTFFLRERSRVLATGLFLFDPFKLPFRAYLNKLCFSLKGVVYPVAKQLKTVKQQTKTIDVTYKQGLFIQCTADEVLFGGAAGG
jgi:hypothetical protein